MADSDALAEFRKSVGEEAYQKLVEQSEISRLVRGERPAESIDAELERLLKAAG